MSIAYALSVVLASYAIPPTYFSTLDQCKYAEETIVRDIESAAAPSRVISHHCFLVGPDGKVNPEKSP